MSCTPPCLVIVPIYALGGALLDHSSVGQVFIPNIYQSLVIFYSLPTAESVNSTVPSVGVPFAESGRERALTLKSPPIPFLCTQGDFYDNNYSSFCIVLDTAHSFQVLRNTLAELVMSTKRNSRK